MAIRQTILQNELTNKQRILQMVERWPEDISFERAFYHVYALKQIDEGLKDIEAGRTKDFDDVFDELERRCDEEESLAAHVGSGRKRPGSPAKSDRGVRRAKNGQVVREPAKKTRKQVT